MLSDYELQRERNIASNNERLAELGLEGGLAPKQKKAESKPKRQRADPDWKPERTTRVSGRPAAAAAAAAVAATKNEQAEDSDGSSDDDDDDEDIPLPKRIRAAKPEVKPKEVKPKEVKQPSEASDLCFTIEAAKTGRSKCRGCMEALEQGEMRVGMESWMVGRAVTVWQHPRCFADNVVVTVESSGRGKCKQTKVAFTKGEAKLSCTAHSTTAHFKPAAVAAQIRQVFALAAGRKVEGIEGFKQLSKEDARALRDGAPARAAKPEPEPELELEATPSQAVALKEEEAPAQPAKGSVSRAKGKVCWRFAGHLCYGSLLPAQESKTHCYARTHKGNTKTLTKGGASWWMEN